MMDLSLSSISAGAMTAAVSMGSTLQHMGASATAAAQSLPATAAVSLPNVAAAPAVQAMGQGMAANAAATAANLQQVLPANAHAAAASTARLATDIAMVEKPTRVIATATNTPTLVRVAGFLSKALPVVTIGVSTLSGAKVAAEHGPQGLLTRKEGRGAVLGAVGGALLLVPLPVTQLAAAGVLAATAVNHFGGMDGLNDGVVAGRRVVPIAAAPAAAPTAAAGAPTPAAAAPRTV